MSTIGLAHRRNRDFVVDWLEADASPSEPDEGLSARVDAVRASAHLGTVRTRPGEAPADAERDAPGPWLPGEPPF